MAKYYLLSGEFRTIKDAKDHQEGMRKAVLELFNGNLPHTLFMGVSERGFESSINNLYPMIPVLRDLGIDLPSDECLISAVCESLGVKRISDDEKEWILYGRSIRE